MSHGHLPSRFPIGTKLIVEARRSGRSRVFRSHLEFPDGRILRLPERAVARGKAPQERRRLQAR